MSEVATPAIAIGPNIHPHDGKLDLMILSSASVFGAVRILLKVLTRRFKGQRDLVYLSGSRVRISATPPLPTQIDGEPLSTTPLYIKAVPNGAFLIVPQEYQALAQTPAA